MAGLWHQHSGSGFGGGPLPFAGGAAEQPALVMEAFAVLGQATADLKTD